ncbi:MAG: carbamoyl-phosphate synthase large subunit [Firmicutes bacterium]|nr:carbamoyl-phosphate synthase large subunit [Bacillota bacterium]
MRGGHRAPAPARVGGAVPSGGGAGPARGLAPLRRLHIARARGGRAQGAGRGRAGGRGGDAPVSPRLSDLRKVMVIGSGPIIIGQAAEFDYAGTQACQALREEGLEVVLLNSNPATIMTDVQMADRVYIEPLTPEVAEAIIARERPEGLVATLGGQAGLNLAMKLVDGGILEKYGVRLLGTPAEAIRQAEDRELFKKAMQRIGQPVPDSAVCRSVEEALRFAREVGLPLIVRPAYTLGGTGGGVARSEEELEAVCRRGLRASPIGEVLVERSLLGWKEIEYEVMRDGSGAMVAICPMENLDPVGVHTGDSIVVAPTQTLTDRELQMLRTAAFEIIAALGIEGGCNVQFALDPQSRRYHVIEVNPRVSRSSALASKATGYPIARVAAKIAAGLRLDEIPNPVTGTTRAFFEPTLDYVVVKMPRWPFDKFGSADRGLSTQMKATGEVMAIERTLEAALLKAVRSLDIGLDGLDLPEVRGWTDAEIEEALRRADDRRLFVVAEALRRGFGVERVARSTGIDRYFVRKIENVLRMERRLALAGGPQAAATPAGAAALGLERRAAGGEAAADAPGAAEAVEAAEAAARAGAGDARAPAGAEAAAAPRPLPPELWREAKVTGLSDARIAAILGLDPLEVRRRRAEAGVRPVYKMVDTCAAEFEARTPYFYSTYEEEDEARAGRGRAVVVLGSGPIRIGQGIEFDYCSVHAVWALRRMGYEAVIVNNNPETVSTDFNTSDRLYFEPLDVEAVLNVVERERPLGVIAQFGGQTAINLAAPLAAAGVPILGTAVEDIDRAEDRAQFDALLGELGLPRPPGGAATSLSRALAVAGWIGYPVLVRPSYVLGGRAMRICHGPEELTEYMKEAVTVSRAHPVLIDRYLGGLEVEVDAVSDGETVVIPGILEHIERAGIHSGDSIAVYPPRQLDPEVQEELVEATIRLARALRLRGLMNVQYVVHKGRTYVLEVNPRASRTVPILTKVTGVPMVELATRAIMGESLRALGWTTGLVPPRGHWAVKVPVFSFAKLSAVETGLGPEMKSTGEVMGLAVTYEDALQRGFVAAGLDAPPEGGRVLLTIADRDKDEAVPIARRLAVHGYRLLATPGTAARLRREGMEVETVEKIGDEHPNVLDALRGGAVDLVINTLTYGTRPERDGFRIRRVAVEMGVPCLTSLDTARAFVEGMLGRRSGPVEVRALQEYAPALQGASGGAS